MYVNQHQKCELEQREREIKQLTDQLLDTRVQLSSKPCMSSQVQTDQTVGRLQQQIDSKNAEIDTLQKDLQDLKTRYNTSLEKIDDAHRLIERHLSNAVAHEEETTFLKSQKEKLDRDVSDLKQSLDDVQKELEDALCVHKDATEKWKSQIEEKNKKTEDLVSDLEQSKKAYEELEELNSSWAKQNLQLSLCLQDAKAKLEVPKTDTNSQTDLSLLCMEDQQCQTEIQTNARQCQTDVLQSRTVEIQTTNQALASCQVQTDQAVCKVSSTQTIVPAVTNTGVQATVCSQEKCVQAQTHPRFQSLGDCSERIMDSVIQENITTVPFNRDSENEYQLTQYPANQIPSYKFLPEEEGTSITTHDNNNTVLTQISSADIKLTASDSQNQRNVKTFCPVSEKSTFLDLQINKTFGQPTEVNNTNNLTCLQDQNEEQAGPQQISDCKKLHISHFGNTSETYGLIEQRQFNDVCDGDNGKKFYSVENHQAASRESGQYLDPSCPPKSPGDTSNRLSSSGKTDENLEIVQNIGRFDTISGPKKQDTVTHSSRTSYLNSSKWMGNTDLEQSMANRSTADSYTKQMTVTKKTAEGGRESTGSGGKQDVVLSTSGGDSNGGTFTVGGIVNGISGDGSRNGTLGRKKSARNWENEANRLSLGKQLSKTSGGKFKLYQNVTGRIPQSTNSSACSRFPTDPLTQPQELIQPSNKSNTRDNRITNKGTVAELLELAVEKQTSIMAGCQFLSQEEFQAPVTKSVTSDMVRRSQANQPKGESVKNKFDKAVQQPSQMADNSDALFIPQSKIGRSGELSPYSRYSAILQQGPTRKTKTSWSHLPQELSTTDDDDKSQKPGTEISQDGKVIKCFTSEKGVVQLGTKSGHNDQDTRSNSSPLFTQRSRGILKGTSRSTQRITSSKNVHFCSSPAHTQVYSDDDKLSGERSLFSDTVKNELSYSNTPDTVSVETESSPKGAKKRKIE